MNAVTITPARTSRTAATSRSLSGERIVLALAPMEREIFFTAENRLPFDVPYQWYTPGECDWKTYLQRTRPTILISGWTTPPIPPEWIDDADCPLRYVCHLTGSIRRIVPRSFVAQGKLVTNWGGLAATTVAEHALLLALCALRNLRGWDGVIHTRDQSTPPTSQLQTRSLFGRAVGIHGFGQVARTLCTLLKPFGVTIRAHTRGLTSEMIRREGVIPCASLEELFSQSDVLFECEALNADNANSVNADVLAQLPDGAVFINVGRGQLVDETALQLESASGRLRVALDVFQSEPIDGTLPFLSHRDAIISPHIAGPTADHYHRCTQLALENVGRYLAGQPLESVITAEVYDRST